MLIDMPLEKLKKYMGTNPCPEDIDRYWDRAMDEMENSEPDVQLIPSDFQAPYAECFDMYFTGVRKARIHAKFIRPKKITEKHPAVLMFHGYGGNCGDWNSKLQFAAMGYTVAALDCRGQNGLSNDSGGISGTTLKGQIIRGLDDHEDNFLFRQIFLDTAMLAKIISSMEDVDKNRIGAFGGSQGGGLTLACGALAPYIKKLAPVYPFLSDYQRVWEMDLAKDAYAELKEYFRNYDPTHSRQDEIFYKLGYIDIKNITKRIKGKVLMGTGLMDTVCPPSTQFAAYNRINSEKDVVIYPDFGHETLNGFQDMTFQFMSDL